MDAVSREFRLTRITLGDAARDRRKALRRAGPAPKGRDIIEMVSLSDAGLSPPRIPAPRGSHR